MRIRALAAGALALLCALGFSSDYKLFLPASAKSAVQSKGIFVFDQGKTLKVGDWIVDISFGPAPKDALSCTVVASNDPSTKPLLAPAGAIKGFGGKVYFSQTAAPADAIQAKYVLVASPVPVSSEKDVIGVAASRIKQWPWALILLGLAAVGAAVYGFIHSRNTSPNGPVKGRLMYEQNLREVREFLDRINDAQRKLVKNPPVVRFFKRDIESFKHRLDALETSTRSIEASTQQIAEAVAAVDRVVRTISVVEAKLSKEIGAVQRSVESKATDLQIQVDSVSRTLPGLQAADENLLAELQGTSSRLSLELHAMNEALKSGFVQDQVRIEELREALAGAQSQFAEAGSKAEAHAAATQHQFAERSKELAAHLAALQKSVAAENAQLAQQVHEQVAQSDAKLTELAAGLTAAGQATEALGQQLQAHQGDLSSLRADSSKTLAQLQQSLADGVGQLDERLKGHEASTQAWGQALQKAVAEDLKRVEASLVERQAAEAKALSQSFQTSVAALQSKAEAVEATLQQLGSPEAGVGEAVAQAQIEITSHVDTQLAKVAEAQAKAQGAASDQVRSLSAKLAEMDKALEQVHGSLKTQADRLGKFESLERAVNALHADLKALSSQDGQKKAAVSTQSLRLEQLSQDVNSVQESLKAVADLGSSLSKLQDQVATLASRPVETSAPAEAPSVDVSALKAEFSEIRDEMRKLAAQAAQAAQVAASESGVPVVVPALDTSAFESAVASLKAEFKAAIEALPKEALQTATTGGAEVGVLAAQLDAIQSELQSLKALPSAPAASLDPAHSFESVAAALRQQLTELSDSLHSTTHGIAARLGEVERAVKDAPRPAPQVTASASKPAAEAQPRPVPLEVVEGTFEAPAKPKTTPSTKESSAPSTSPLTVVTSPEPVGSGELHLPNPLPGRRMTWGAVRGGSNRGNSVEATFPLGLPLEIGNARTPLATPEAGYPVGALLFQGDEAIYAHGETIRTFWPGRSERVIELGTQLPADDWRLMLWEDHLFVAEEGCVRVLDSETLEEVTNFNGAYLDQVSTSFHWIGITSMNGFLAVDYRNLKGKQIGQPRITDAPATEKFMTATAGNTVYLASVDGKLFRVTEQTSEACAQLEGRLITMTSYGANLVALTETRTGIKAHLIQPGDKPTKTIDLHTESVFNQGVVMGEKFYVVDRRNRQIRVINLPKFKLLEPVNLADADSICAIAGIEYDDQHWLAIGLAPGGDRKGSVAILDAHTGNVTPAGGLSMSQAKLLFAHGLLVVSTSSAYQNMIRILDPFGMAEENRAAA